MVGTGNHRWAVTLVVVLVVALVALIGIGGLRLAQMRSVPMAAARAPIAGAGAPDVEVSVDAWLHPASGATQHALGRYFEAINRHSYADWARAVTPARAAVESEAVWNQTYRSTRDGTIRISRIDDLSGGRLIAFVSFVSQQDPQDSPEPFKNKVDQVCWRISFVLAGDPLRVDQTPSGNILLGKCPPPAGS